MDSPLSPNPDADINNVRSFYFKIENDVSCPTTLKNKTTLVKYTKLPDYDFDSKVCQSLKPRLRRIMEIDHPQLQTSRSLKLGAVSDSKMNSSTKRKIVSITENDEDRLTPHIGKVLQSSNRSSRTTLQDDKSAAQNNILKSSQVKLGAQSTNRSSGTNQKDNKSAIHRNYLKSTNTDNSTRAMQASKLNVKTNNTTNKREHASPKPIQNSKQAIVSNHSLHDIVRSKSTKDKGQGRPVKSTPNPPRVNLSKNLVIPRESDEFVIAMNNDSSANSNKTASSKRVLEKNRFNSKSPQHNTVVKILNKVSLGNPLPVIHVPLDNCNESEKKQIGLERVISVPVQNSVDCSTGMDQNFLPRDANVGTSPLPVMVNEETETSNNSTEVTQDVFDNLDIPNVTLIKDKSIFAKEEIVSFCSRSMPNLQTSPFKISPEKESCDDPVGSGRAKTYIIGRATFTYTTKQKINFHVVGSSDDSQSNQSPSPLAYPLNVVSLLKKSFNHCDISESSEDHLTNKSTNPNSCHKNVDKLQALACPYVFNNNKLVKPSDLISTIRVNNGLLHNDYISEQFQRELHFIDSFFESLQYLENCSLSEKCLSEASNENWVSKSRFDLKNSEYNSFLSKLERGGGVLANVDDIETMASKSLCLLNLLIRNEQRRAKNLLFVLKMREDALKDFTKSQIIWLENKKKQDNTDVSTLKKKQRGALLKLQHECGEMQRMRKALVTLSERRKAALVKTRNSIELKLKNNVDVEQILLGKKKLKRNISADRNVAPLKCFDLSSSGCEESSSSKPKETPVLLQEFHPANSCAEKCVQTGDSICEPTGTAERATDTAENFVAVDGGYLNIIFQNLSLPQIFSCGKQYEVNEEALRNILESSNKCHLKDHCDSDVVENFMDKIRNRDSDRSSSASTAHSLVDEFDQYYKGLSDRSKSPADSPDPEHYAISQHNPQSRVYELSESCVQTMDINLDKNEKNSEQNIENIVTENVKPVLSSETLTCDQIWICDSSDHSVELEPLKNGDSTMSLSQAGPLPVPPGATSPEPLVTDGSDSSVTSFGSSIKSDLQSLDSVVSSSLGYSEVEELRRQQLAIEREVSSTGSSGARNLDSVVSSLVYSEEEELRRQQLAIEREVSSTGSSGARSLDSVVSSLGYSEKELRRQQLAIEREVSSTGSSGARSLDSVVSSLGYSEKELRRQQLAIEREVSSTGSSGARNLDSVVSSLVYSEEEELRRQQLAIEREVSSTGSSGARSLDSVVSSLGYSEKELRRQQLAIEREVSSTGSSGARSLDSVVSSLGYSEMELRRQQLAIEREVSSTGSSGARSLDSVVSSLGYSEKELRRQQLAIEREVSSTGSSGARSLDSVVSSLGYSEKELRRQQLAIEREVSSTGSSGARSLDSVVSSLGYSEKELRRQLLAIEREIKALEQQQNQPLVVREIPDKPPPPYTPPNNALAKTSRMFVLNDDLEEKIHRHIAHGEDFPYDPSDAFSVFIKDICEESLARQKQELSDQPWDACNLLPDKQELSPEKRGLKTISEVKQVLSGISPTVVSGVGARRSDHIDDILFSEWRRCEPEWTNLHSEEAGVKAQVFESLFQKVLSETIDQYKHTVLGLITPDAMDEKSFRKKNKPPKLGET